MRTVLLALTMLAAGCAANPPAAVNQPAGKYRDFADYMLAHDATIMQDARAKGATPEQAHCAAESYGIAVLQSDYFLLSDAVSGKRQITRQDEQWAWNRVRMATHDKSKSQALIDNAWAKCA